MNKRLNAEGLIKLVNHKHFLRQKTSLLEGNNKGKKKKNKLHILSRQNGSMC